MKVFDPENYEEQWHFEEDILAHFFEHGEVTVAVNDPSHAAAALAHHSHDDVFVTDYGRGTFTFKRDAA